MKSMRLITLTLIAIAPVGWSQGENPQKVRMAEASGVVRKKSIPPKSASIVVRSGGLLDLEPCRRKLALNEAPFNSF
ncbi:MAG TPA: hypothetical protein VEV41_25405 [Terriglobales bacterium]|nr:hypothetical protein [Terriglobales bacterium]